MDIIILNVVELGDRGIDDGFHEEYKMKLESDCSVDQGMNYHDIVHRGKQALRGKEETHSMQSLVPFRPYYGKPYVDSSHIGIDGTLCINGPLSIMPILNDILHSVSKKVVSFAYILDMSYSYSQWTNGMNSWEIRLGDPDSSMFLTGTETYFVLEDIANRKNTAGWATADLITILIEKRSGGAKRHVQFDIGNPITLLPSDMYNTIINPYFRASLLPLGDFQLIEDLKHKIYEYADVTKPTTLFHCSKAKELLGFSFNGISIPREYLYVEISPGNCLLRIAEQPSINITDVVIGLHLMKRFHFVFDVSEDETTLTFRERDLFQWEVVRVHA